MAVILAIMSLFYEYVPSSLDRPKVIKGTSDSDKETTALLDSTSRNYGASSKTVISKL